MANLNAIIRERKQVLNAFKAKARMVQDSSDAMIRHLTRLIVRKRNVPTIDDYASIVEGFKKIVLQIDEFQKQLDAGQSIFT